VKGTARGRQFFRCTDKSRKADALIAARALWKAFLEERDDVLKATRLRQDRAVATVGEIIRAHGKFIRSFKLRVEPATLADYESALRRVVTWGKYPEFINKECGRVYLSAEQQAVVDGESGTVFTETFKQRYIGMAGNDYEERDSRINGALATMRFARAMFDVEAMKCYRSLVMPDLKGFLGASMPEAPKRKPKVVTDTMVHAMATAAQAIKETEPALYLVHLLFRHFGLGNDEIEHALVGWISPCQAGDLKGVVLPSGECRPIIAYLDVRWRADWRAKTDAREGRVAVSADVYAELQQWLRNRGPDELLVPAGTKTDRWELINKAHNDFVRPWLADFRKRSYELRRWGASKVAELHQNDAMGSWFLRHSPKTTGTKYYLKAPVPAPITLGDCGAVAAWQCPA
jgi:hypothetical protein